MATELGQPASAPTVAAIPPWSDKAGWNQAPRYVTIQAADVDGDGKAELLGRNAGGMDTWVFNAATAQWEPLSSGTCNWTDANGWNQPQYYATIGAADVDGDGRAELYGRG